jgi:hypothetical protein
MFPLLIAGWVGKPVKPPMPPGTAVPVLSSGPNATVRPHFLLLRTVQYGLQCVCGPVWVQLLDQRGDLGRVRPGPRLSCIVGSVWLFGPP